MVRLQKRFAYKYKDKEHYKHVITIPDEIVEELGWKEGEELHQAIHERTLIVSSPNSKKTKSQARRAE